VIFPPPLYGKVLRSEKTQTRRLAQHGDLATKYRPGMRRAVQRGRGIPNEAHIILTDVRRELLGAIDYEAVRAEGFRTVPDFKAYWLGLHDKAWTERNREEVAEEYWDDWLAERGADRFYQRWAFKEVWVLTFELDRTERPRLLADRNAKADYVEAPARALDHEPEAVDASTQDRFSKEGHHGFVAREKQREIDRERLAVHDRLQRVQTEARAAGVDIVQFELGILQRLRAAERKIHQRRAA
jgi:hypothetical protein